MGVDLSLDRFSLSEHKKLSQDVASANLNRKLIAPGCPALGRAFWRSLDRQPPMFKKEDHSLLRSVFNPNLSDRRADGDCFIPPETRCGYIEKLRKLVAEEEMVRQTRKNAFCSALFNAEDPGELFPWSWRPLCAIAARGSEGRVPLA